MHTLFASILNHGGFLLAQATDADNASGVHYDVQSNNPVAGAIGGVIGLVFGLIIVVALWKIFTKAGRPGWASLIPIYNAYTLLKVAGKPGWWLILMIIPFVNFIIIILMGLGLAQNFGKGGGFGIGIAFLSPIFLPILGFGNARYQGALPAHTL